MSIRIYVAAFYGAAAIVASGIADAGSTRAYDEYAGGQLEASMGDHLIAADVLRTDVDATIRDGIAEIQMRQVFSGLGAGASDATYLLPLGKDANVIAIEVAEGSRVERKQIDDFGAFGSGAPRMFAQDLSLQGSSPVEITLIYRQPVSTYEDTHRLVLPIAVLPGGDIGDGMFETADLSPEYADLPDYLCGELTMPDALGSDRVSVSVSIDATSFAGIYSDSHAIDVTAIETGRVIELSPSEPIANRSFVLDYVPAGPAITIVAQAGRSQ